MWNPFRRIKKHSEPEYIETGIPEPGLDKWGRDYRRQRIREIAVMTEKSIEDATKLADRWFIRTVQVQTGEHGCALGKAVVKYVPNPVWDDEWGFRPMFDTRDEAMEHIIRKHGKMLTGE